MQPPDERCNRRKWKDPQWWQVWIQAPLVPAGIAALIIYAYQLDQMRKSTDAASESVKIAKESRELSRLDQRAWISAWKITGKLELNKPMTVQIGMKNSGKTFARKVESAINWQWADSEVAAPDFEEVERQFNSLSKSQLLMPPNGEYVTGLDVRHGEKFAQKDIDEILTGKKIVLVYGKIKYQDVFGCDHWTEFCTRYSAVASEPINDSFVFCESHNDADENKCP